MEPRGWRYPVWLFLLLGLLGVLGTLLNLAGIFILGDSDKVLVRLANSISMALIATMWFTFAYRMRHPK